MKNKDFTQKSKRKFSHSATKALVVFIAILTFLWLSVPIIANSSFRVENCNKCEEYSQKLGEEINAFIMLDTEPTKTVSTQVTAAVNEYRKEIIDLQSHADVENRSLENEILLAYTKGNAAGRVAWVYYYNIYTFLSDSSSNKISAKYASCKTAIATSTQHTVLAAECDVMLDELNRLIYTERAKNLALPNDSLTASSLISGAVENFKSIYSNDLFGKAYAEAYEKLTEDLGLQRVRDAIKNDAEKTFKAIRTSESFSTSAEVSLLVYELENAQSVKSMNNAYLNFTQKLLSIDESKPYSSIAKKRYLEEAQITISRATESQTASVLSDIFAEYPLTIKKSEIKDSVYALFLGNGNTTDEKLIELEQSFNKDGGIIDGCKNDSEVDTELINAKAALFIHKHGEILNKPFDDLAKSDEELAKNALVEYSSLEEKVKIKLLNEINIIAEKYNNILIIKMRSYVENDELYLDFCEIITKEIKSLPRENIDEFYNKASRIPQKAEALANVIKEYRTILSAENYKGYEKEEKDDLLSVLSELSSLLSKIDPSDVAIYADEISDAKNSAIRKLNVIDQSARVRIATRSSKNAEVINELKAAYEKIALCAEKSEMSLQANRAIYKIERLLTSDAILNSCDELKKSITAMDFLEKSEKESFSASISALEIKSKDAKEAENISALKAIWDSFSDSLDAIRAEAEAIDLSRAISAYIEKVSETTKVKLEALSKLKYIAKEKSDEIYNAIKAEEQTSKINIPLCKSTAEVLTQYAEFLKNLGNLFDSANLEDLNGYKIFIVSALDKYDEIKANYSDENYNKILEIKSNAKQKLANATSESECDSIIKAAENEILLINDLLDDEKENALSSLLALLETLKKDSPLYSPESFSKIEGYYDEGKLEIGKINNITNISSVKQTLSKYISLMRSVRKDTLYTNESAHNISTPSLQYPSDYDYSKGLLGKIHLPNGIMCDASFTINVLEIARNKQVEELIRKSVKSGQLSSVKRIPDETLKLLRSASVAATLDISLSSIDQSASGYTVQMLIPNQLCGENILGLAFVKGEDVEFYPISQVDSLISTNLQHFSKYYIVVESTLNVKPLLIALMILLCLEFLVLIAIIYLRYKRKTEVQNQAKSDLPELPMSAIIPFVPALTRVYPENGISLAILLSIAALALASTIALLIHRDAKASQQTKETQKQLKGKKEPMLLSEGNRENNSENSFFDNTEDELCIVGASVKSRINKAEIDLDVIADNFKSGETVNLNALKAKGLVDESTEYIKILTKGNLTKPLTIEANEFSNAAKEVVELSGGEARKIVK